MRPEESARLEALKLIHVENKHDRAANRNFDRARNERAGRRGFKWHYVDQLFARLAVLSDDFLESGQVGFVHSDKKCRVPLSKESTRGADDRELETRLEEFVRNFVFVPVVDDADDEFHKLIIADAKKPFDSLNRRATDCPLCA